MKHNNAAAARSQISVDDKVHNVHKICGSHHGHTEVILAELGHPPSMSALIPTWWLYSTERSSFFTSGSRFSYVD